MPEQLTVNEAGRRYVAAVQSGKCSVCNLLAEEYRTFVSAVLDQEMDSLTVAQMRQYALGVLVKFGLGPTDCNMDGMESGIGDSLMAEIMARGNRGEL